MISQSEGIVLHTIKYSETSVISQIYTKEYGIQSFILNNARGSKSKMSFFQPLSILIINFYHTKNSLHRIKEISFKSIQTNMYSSIVTSTIALFIAEFLYKLCNSSEKNEAFYSFLEESILDLEKNPSPNSHILLLLRTTYFWGIQPNLNYSNTHTFFDLHSGDFTNIQTQHTSTAKIGTILHSLIQETEFTSNIEINRSERKELILNLLEYFSYHTHNLKLTDTLRILETVFND